MLAQTSARLTAPLLLLACLPACRSTGPEAPLAPHDAPPASLEQDGQPARPSAREVPQEEAQPSLAGPCAPSRLELRDGQLICLPELPVPSFELPSDLPYIKGPTGGGSRQEVNGGLQPTHTWPQLAFQPTIQIVPAADTQESINRQAWLDHRAFLGGLARGTWVVIADGLLRGTYATAEEAWRAALDLRADLDHAYVYRVGIDDQPETVELSPVVSSLGARDSAAWTQVGRSLARPWKLVMEAATDTWHRPSERGGSTSVTWGDAGARFELVGTNGEHRRVPGVISALVQQDLTVTREDAEALGLLRFQSPMPCTYGPEAETCPRVLVRVEVPELGLSSVALAVVLPER
jgi:hypothetical protein